MGTGNPRITRILRFIRTTLYESRYARLTMRSNIKNGFDPNAITFYETECPKEDTKGSDIAS